MYEMYSLSVVWNGLSLDVHMTEPSPQKVWDKLEIRQGCSYAQIHLRTWNYYYIIREYMYKHVNTYIYEMYMYTSEQGA